MGFYTLPATSVMLLRGGGYCVAVPLTWTATAVVVDDLDTAIPHEHSNRDILRTASRLLQVGLLPISTTLLFWRLVYLLLAQLSLNSVPKVPDPNNPFRSRFEEMTPHCKICKQHFLHI